MNNNRNNKNRSAVTNGTKFFIEGDRVHSNGDRARRIRDHYELLAAELGDNPTDSQDGLLRRAAALATVCELTETGIAAGEDVDMKQYLQVTTQYRACLTQLGIARPTRALTKAEAKTADPMAAAMEAMDNDE